MCSLSWIDYKKKKTFKKRHHNKVEIIYDEEQHFCMQHFSCWKYFLSLEKPVTNQIDIFQRSAIQLTL